MEKEKETVNLKTVVKDMKNEEWEQLVNKSKVIEEITRTPASISLEEFEVYFLPFFLEEVGKDEVNTQIFMYNFLEKTEGSYHREIEVKDKEGSVLFILPPLFLDVNVANPDLSISFIVSKLNTLIESGYYGAEKEVTKGLNEILKSLGTDKELYKKYIIEFNRIIETYSDRFINAYKRKKGIPVEETKQQVEDKTKEKKKMIDEEDDIFDY